MTEEAAASAPLSRAVAAESPDLQPRALWLGSRLICGSLAFFFASFLFAYFYLQALDSNHSWKIGSVHPSQGLGVAIMAGFLLSAVIFRLASRRPNDVFAAGIIALILALVAIALQFFEYTKLDFGAASGGYAAVFFGWTSLYAIVALAGVYWIETQVATLWRVRREGVRGVREGVPAHDTHLLQAGLEACSFYWAFYVAIGVLAWIVLYLV